MYNYGQKIDSIIAKGQAYIILYESNSQSMIIFLYFAIFLVLRGGMSRALYEDDGSCLKPEGGRRDPPSLSSQRDHCPMNNLRLPPPGLI